MFLISLINSNTSSDEAVPWFIIKFACFSDISALPIFKPFNPALSIKYPANKVPKPIPIPPNIPLIPMALPVLLDKFTTHEIATGW